MALTLKDMFKSIHTNQAEREYVVILSYIEIYNENIRDLLQPTAGIDHL